MKNNSLVTGSTFFSLHELPWCLEILQFFDLYLYKKFALRASSKSYWILASILLTLLGLMKEILNSSLHIPVTHSKELPFEVYCIIIIPIGNFIYFIS